MGFREGHSAGRTNKHPRGSNVQGGQLDLGNTVLYGFIMLAYWMVPIAGFGQDLPAAP